MPASDIVIAAAQVACLPGAIQQNITHHLYLIEQAAAAGVALLVFPELSLTGYELTLASFLALTLDDPRLHCFSQRAQQYQMTLAIGAPLHLANTDAVYIATLIFSPDGNLTYYTKQHLHAGEQRYIQAGCGGSTLTISGQRVALAICAETHHPLHAQQAAQAGVDIYAAAVLSGVTGYAKDAAQLRHTAQKYGMAVLMANHATATGGWPSAGKSAIWSPQGETVAVAIDDRRAQLVIAQRQGGAWYPLPT